LFSFVVPWRLVQAEDMPYRAIILAGKVNLGDAGVGVFGVLRPPDGSADGGGVVHLSLMMVTDMYPSPASKCGPFRLESG
jgi:hypothetical protein